MKEISKKTALFQIRKSRNLTQRQLAELVNASTQQISQLENGDHKLAPEWLDRLSKVLNCSKAELLGETPPVQLSDRERLLLDYFRKCDAAGQDLMLRTGDTVSKLISPKDHADKAG